MEEDSESKDKSVETVISYFAAFLVIRSVGQQEGHGLQAGTVAHNLCVDFAVCQHCEVMRGDRDVGARHDPADKQQHNQLHSAAKGMRATKNLGIAAKMS